MNIDTEPRSEPHKKPEDPAREAAGASELMGVSRIAVGVNGLPEGRDAAALGAAIAEAAGADLQLVAVYPPALFPAPPDLDWKHLHKQALRTLREVRDSVAPDATVQTATDLSMPRALHRVSKRRHRDLLVVGSSHRAPPGKVGIARSSRQLLGYSDCALAIAPRGFSSRMDFRLRRIGVGYDGGPEAGAALQVAASLAIAAGAKLCIRAVVDDRVPVLLRSALQGMVSVEWRDILYEQMNGLRDEAAAAAEKLGAVFESEVVFGRPAEELAKLSDQVDLLVVGSRRWGTIARVLLGSTGEALVQCAASPLIIVPRPRV